MEERIRMNRPNIKTSTIISYIKHIKHVCKHIDEYINTAEDIVEHEDKIFKYLNSLAPTNARTRAAALASLLDTTDKTPEQIRTMKRFHDEVSSYKKKHNEDMENDTSNKSELEWSDILDKYSALENRIKKIDINNVSKEEYQDLQMYVILSCYVMIPPRRSLDYLMFKIRKPSNEFNYMMKKGKKYYFVFNEYKTNKKYGRTEIEVPNKLASIIRMWRMVCKGEYLILNKHRLKPINCSQLNILLSDFLGKNIGTNKLRKLYLSSLFTEADKEKYKEMKETALKMAHNVNTAMTYYVLR